MATKTQVELIDDLDGSAADETVEFGIDGVNYAIDLSDAHAKDLRGELEAYKAAARRVGKAQRQPAQRKASSGPRYNRETTAQQRTWARAHGWPDLKDRGRVPNAVVEAWEQAHPTERAA